MNSWFSAGVSAGWFCFALCRGGRGRSQSARLFENTFSAGPAQARNPSSETNHTFHVKALSAGSETTLTHLHGFYPKAEGAGRRLLLSEPHVPKFGNCLQFVFLGTWCISVHPHHLQNLGQWLIHVNANLEISAYLLVKVWPGHSSWHFRLEKRSGAHFDVHHARVVEPAQEIFQLNE
jgi:hypothetical protein